MGSKVANFAILFSHGMGPMHFDQKYWKYIGKIRKKHFSEMQYISCKSQTGNAVEVAKKRWHYMKALLGLGKNMKALMIHCNNLHILKYIQVPRTWKCHFHHHQERICQICLCGKADHKSFACDFIIFAQLYSFHSCFVCVRQLSVLHYLYVLDIFGTLPFKDFADCTDFWIG